MGFVARLSSNASQLAAALRSYLRYRTTCGDQVGALTAAITNPVHWSLASLLRALKPSEVILSTFVKRGLIDKDDAAEMRAWAHDGGF